mgnify:FL=1
MTPIPQYPLYSATITLYNDHLIGYYLDEDHEWGLDMNELELRVKEAEEQGIKLKGLVIINPGNPTGMVGALFSFHRSVWKRRRCKTAFASASIISWFF